MRKKNLIVGIIVLIIGISLLFGYWPLTAEEGREVAYDYNDSTFDYGGYEPGDDITIYGEIQEIKEVVEIGDLKRTRLVIDGVGIYTTKVPNGIEKGDEVYAKVNVNEIGVGEFTKEYLSLKEIGHKYYYDYVFIGITVIGGLIALSGAVLISEEEIKQLRQKNEDKINISSTKKCPLCNKKELENLEDSKWVCKNCGSMIENKRCSNCGGTGLKKIGENRWECIHCGTKFNKKII